MITGHALCSGEPYRSIDASPPLLTPVEVVYQVTFLVTGMMSYIAGQLFGVNGEMA